jgi:hypothetical protein
MSKNDEFKLAVLRLAGFATIILAIYVGTLIPAHMSGLTALLTAAVGWYVGKLTEKPMTAVTVEAAKELPPAAASNVVRFLSHRPRPLDFTDEPTPTNRARRPPRNLDP